jgi:hypothetical protein
MPQQPLAPKLPETNTTQRQALWSDSGGYEERYSLKPEPYSLESGQKDPELLGPQSTIKRSLLGEEMMEAPTEVPQNNTAGDEGFLSRDKPSSDNTAQSTAQTMTRSHCIDLIGKAKFDEYTQRYGSESAALRKCTILQRVQQ